PRDLARPLLELFERAATEIEHFGAQAAPGRGLRAQQGVASERRAAFGERQPCFIRAPARVARALDPRSVRSNFREAPCDEGKRCLLGGASRQTTPAIAERVKILPQRGIGGERAVQTAERFLVHLIGVRERRASNRRARAPSVWCHARFPHYPGPATDVRR